MIEGQCEVAGRRHHLLTPDGSHLLRQHPILIPAILLMSAFGLCVTSYFADNLFPVLALVGAPATLVCLSAALVLGVSGVLASIISIIEGIDRYRLRSQLETGTFLKPKGA